MICSALIGLAASSVGLDGPPRIDRKKIAQVKSAFLLNFLKFTEWSHTTLPNENSPYIIGVFGDDDLEKALESTMKKGSVRNHPIQVLRSKVSKIELLETESAEDAAKLSPLRAFVAKCHLVYIPSSSTKLIDSFFIENAFKDALIVSDDKSVLKRGGQIAFALEEGHIVFFTSLENLKQKNFKVSSKLLQLARTDR